MDITNFKNVLMKVIKFPNKLKDTLYKRAFNENCKESKKIIINSFLNGENGFEKDISEVRRLVINPVFGEIASKMLFEYLKSNEKGELALNNDIQQTLKIKETFDDVFLKQNNSEKNRSLIKEINKGDDFACLTLMNGLGHGSEEIEKNNNLLFDIFWAKNNKVIPKYIVSFCFNQPISVEVGFDKVIDTLAACKNIYMKQNIANK